MKTNKLIIAALAVFTLFMYSCSNNNADEVGEIQKQNDEHSRSAITQTNMGNRNANGELTDASGDIITGCPTHKEMIGSEGDLCPKCNYMKMLPIT